MKRFIQNMIVYATLTATIYLGGVKGVEYAENISLFVIWLFAISGFLALSHDSSKLFKGKIRFPVFLYICRYLMIAFIIAIGWTWTGTFYFLATFFMQVKKKKSNVKIRCR